MGSGLVKSFKTTFKDDDGSDLEEGFTEIHKNVIREFC